MRLYSTGSTLPIITRQKNRNNFHREKDQTMTQATAVKAVTRTVMPGTTFPPIKSIFINGSSERAAESQLIAEVVFHEAPSMYQEKVLKEMLMNHKTTHAGFYVAMQVEGRTIRFRRLGNKNPPTSQGLREMLNSMGIGEITVPQTQSSSEKKKATKNKVTTTQGCTSQRTGLRIIT